MFSSGSLFIAAFVAGCLYTVLIIRAALKVGIRNNNNVSRLHNLEYSLKKDIEHYSCYSNQDNGKWARIKFSALLNRILDSPSIVFHRFIPSHDPGLLYSIKIDEAARVIYVAIGSENFDWHSNQAPQYDRFRT